MNELYKYLDYNFNAQQKMMLRKGIDEGVDISVYANVNYNYLQMEQILQCLIDGVDPSPLLDYEIPYETMEKIRLELYDKQSFFEEKKEQVKRKKLKTNIIILIVVAILITVSSILFINRETIALYFQNIKLELTTNKIKIGMSQTIDPLSYVKDYDKNYKFKYPKVTNFNKPGNYTLEYKISNQVKTITKELIVTVYDDIKPKIYLKANNVTIDYQAKFNIKDYIEKAEDNVDSNVIDTLKYNSIDTSKPGNYTVNLEVNDKANNIAKETLNITVKEAPKPATPQPKPNNQNNNTNATVKNKSINASKYNKYFPGNSIDQYNAANDYAEGILSSGRARGYEILPDGNGFNVKFN